MDQTLISLRYAYGLYYYQDREDLGQKPVDQTHQLDLLLDHAFNERWQAKVTDSFVSAQEPGLVDGGTLRRTQGNNIRNVGKATVNTAWTELFSTEVGYQNSLYDYQQSGIGSYSALLDRLEHLASLDVQWHFTSETMIFVGYAYGQANYTGNQIIDPVTGSVSNNRDSRSHYGYLGITHNFFSNLTLSARGGAQYVDYYNDPNTKNKVSPYADISATYTYLPGSYIQLGLIRREMELIKLHQAGLGKLL